MRYAKRGARGALMMAEPTAATGQPPWHTPGWGCGVLGRTPGARWVRFQSQMMRPMQTQMDNPGQHHPWRLQGKAR